MCVRHRIMIYALLCLVAAVGISSAQEPVEKIDVLLFAADRVAMNGYWYLAAGDDPAPAVLLLHMLNGRAQDWQPLPEELARAGIHALAIDLRGHGESGGRQDWPLARGDVARWWRWLAARPEVDEGALAVIGASIGGNLALLGCVAWEDCRAAFALSPGRDYRGLQPAPALGEEEAPPVTLLAARGDEYSAASILQFAVNASGEVRLWLLPGRAHGTRMFATADGARIRAALLAELAILFDLGVKRRIQRQERAIRCVWCND